MTSQGFIISHYTQFADGLHMNQTEFKLHSLKNFVCTSIQLHIVLNDCHQAVCTYC